MLVVSLCNAPPILAWLAVLVAKECALAMATQQITMTMELTTAAIAAEQEEAIPAEWEAAAKAVEEQAMEMVAMVPAEAVAVVAMAVVAAEAVAVAAVAVAAAEAVAVVPALTRTLAAELIKGLDYLG